MKTIAQLMSIVLLITMASCASQQKTGPTAEANEAQVFHTAQLVEDAGNGQLLVSCSGEGADMAAATLHARMGILHWLATERLAQTKAEKERLRNKMSDLMAETDELVDNPGPANRSGRQGIVRRMNKPEGVEIKLVSKANEAQTRKLLESWGVLDKVALPAGGKLLFLLMPASKGDGKAFRFAQPILQKGLEHLPAEWLDQPKVTSLDYETKMAAAKSASVDILFEISSKKHRSKGAVSYAVILKAVDAKTGRIAAADATQGQRYSDEMPGMVNKALMGAIQDSVAKLGPQLTMWLKQRSQP